MKQFLRYFSVAIFSIFVGSQVTEGMLLLPYWKSLSDTAFYAYYSEFGPAIGSFYTVLTIVAALIPVVIGIYCKISGSGGIKFALVSAFFAIVFIACFYIYFKDANGMFYEGIMSEAELKDELISWGYWHWGRVVVECLSLVFLILAVGKLDE